MFTTPLPSDEPSPADCPLLPRRSPWLLAAFQRYVRWYLPRYFTAVRLARDGYMPAGLGAGTEVRIRESADDRAGPVVVVLNHPSWWDPLICLVLSELFPQRRHYAPMDARSLEQYRFFGRLGFFGIQPDSVAGARVLLRVGQAILHDPQIMLWITAQGRFADVRERPLRLQSGVAHLLARCPGAIVLPLALELVFWNEPFPEALARFGDPVRGDATWTADRWLRQIEAALEANLDALSCAARSRDGGRFLTILSGREGQGGIYGWWKRLRHWAGSRKPKRGRG